jgi:hypothetical protein
MKGKVAIVNFNAEEQRNREAEGRAYLSVPPFLRSSAFSSRK